MIAKVNFVKFNINIKSKNKYLYFIVVFWNEYDW